MNIGRNLANWERWGAVGRALQLRLATPPSARHRHHRDADGGVPVQVGHARTVAQSAPLVARGGYGPPGGVGTLSWVAVGHGGAFGRVFAAAGGVRGVKVGERGYGLIG